MCKEMKVSAGKKGLAADHVNLELGMCYYRPRAKQTNQKKNTSFEFFRFFWAAVSQGPIW